MLTAKDGEFDEAEAPRHGRRRLRHEALLLRRARRPAPRADPTGRHRAAGRPEAGDLRFDPGPRRRRRGDTEVRLTAREASLLEFLLRRAGDVVSKTEILDHVWDDGFDGDPNIVEVYVRHLRNKLDRPFGRAAIETVRGAGLPTGGRRWLRAPASPRRAGRSASARPPPPSSWSGVASWWPRSRCWRSSSGRWSPEVARRGRARAGRRRGARRRGVAADRSRPVADASEEFVQVLARRRRVAASRERRRVLPPIAAAAGRSRAARRPCRSDRIAVRGRAGRAAPGAFTVVVGRNARRRGGGPSAGRRARWSWASRSRLAVVGLVTWWIAGRALRPVERRSAPRSTRISTPSSTGASPTRRATTRSAGSPRR